MIAAIFLIFLGAYLACGLVFAVPFALLGAKKILGLPRWFLGTGAKCKWQDKKAESILNLKKPLIKGPILNGA